MKLHLYVFITAIPLLLCACVTDSNSSGDSLEYPYYASKARAAQIHSGIKKLVIGMSIDDVKKVMGEPDEIRNVFSSPINLKGKPDGFSYFYIIQRKKPFGGIVEKNEKLYRIRFNAKGILIAIEREGITRPRPNK